jgi:circadian clock protein KaiC
MDTMKVKGINALFTSLTHQNKTEFNDETVNAVSSLADTWIDLKNEKRGNERIRTLLVVKTRGMGHYMMSGIYNWRQGHSVYNVESK